ncbi:peptidoglycan-binding domain-containing protein [Sinorhizobium meliloti]|uniref:peptidoglycan-binding domain-containing protein n=1 Tax=Rhizobium meliloti TaxID=382 RepID=UPI001F17329B|nr:peptidoglycan-binding domain-containing protein [Sinorhizobium meliloti]
MTDWGGSRSFFSATDNVLQFQADQRLQVDGDVGPKTRAAMHMALVALTPGEAARPEVNVAPVTEEKLVPVSVTPPSLDAPGWKSNEVITPSVIGGGASLLTAIGGIPWQNLLLILVAFGGMAGSTGARTPIGRPSQSRSRGWRNVLHSSPHRGCGRSRYRRRRRCLDLAAGRRRCQNLHRKAEQ